MVEKDIERAARAVADDMALIGREFGGFVRSAWPMLLAFVALGGGYVWLALRTSAGWTGAAILVGLVTLIVVVPLGPRLWRSHRRRRFVSEWESAVAEVGLPPVPVERADGERLTVRVRGGIAVDDVGAKVKQLEASMGERLRIERDQTHPGRAFVTIQSRDPFEGMASRRWPGLDPKMRPSYWDPCPVGPSERGDEMAIDGARRSVLIGGTTGFGKSRFMSMLIAWAARDPIVRLFMIDGKRIGLRHWEPIAERSESDPEAALEVLQEVNAEIDRRADWLADQPGIRDKLELDDGFGPLVVFIDELADFTLRWKKRGPEFDAALGAIAAKGRFVACSAVVATQVPYVNVISGGTRSNFPLSVAFWCKNLAQSQAILGDYDVDASKLPRIPGRCLIAAEDGGWQRACTYDVTNDQLKQVIELARKARCPT